MVSTYPQRAKARNARQRPEITVLVLSDDWDGPRVQVDGTCEVIDAADDVEPFVEYYRTVAGDHPDWKKYRQAMRQQGKALIRIMPERWGPVATGGFPPEHAGPDRPSPRCRGPGT